MRERVSSLAAALAVVGLPRRRPGSAAAFGTIAGGGQNREHERITRAALAGAADAASDTDCFESRTLDLLAGYGREFGAVGAPDRDELSLPAAHCDNADLLAGEYPRTPEQRGSGRPSRADGRLFRTEGPGARRPRVRGTDQPYRSQKDRGLIDPVTGSDTQPTTPRGMVGDNFSKAVTGAISESRRQWQDLRSALRERYGEQKAQTMIRSLTHDDPSDQCRSPSWTRPVWLTVAIGLAVAVAATLILRRRRRQTPDRET